jgi:hypothetical protein
MKPKGEQKMKWLISLVLALVMVTPAFAGEDPYIAIVGNDCIIPGTTNPAACQGKPWYVSQKYQQFMFDQEAWGIPVCDGTFPAAYTAASRENFKIGCEQFRSQTPQNAPEVCYYNQFGFPPPYDPLNGPFTPGTLWRNALTPAGNSGWYEWYVRLPKKPSGQINLVLQCGVLKPNTFPLLDYEAIELCAAETGERIGDGFCTRDEVNPGTNPLVIGALPKIKAIAYPGPFNAFTPFYLTAFRNPGTYNPFASDTMKDGEGAQVLNGTDSGTRILLKACMDKTVVAKLPVTGQVNAANQEETDLEAGDIIYVRIDIPRANTVDVFCSRQSLKVMGIGEAPQILFGGNPG